MFKIEDMVTEITSTVTFLQHSENDLTAEVKSLNLSIAETEDKP